MESSVSKRKIVPAHAKVTMESSVSRRKIVPDHVLVAQEYAERTSIHGIRYIANSTGGLTERICWTVAFVTCVVCAGWLVSSAWNKYSQSPTVTTVETTHYPLYKVYFPAVTICSANRVKKRVAEGIIARYLNLTEMNDTMKYNAWRVMSIVSILQFPFYGRANEHLKAIPDILPLFTESFNITQFALDTLPRCSEIFYACNWCGQSLNCCEVFHLQPSEAGFCYSFNSLTSIKTKHCRVLEEPDGSLDATESWKDPCIMWRNMGTGAGTGLELFLMPTTEENRIGRGQRDPNGYRVMLHNSLSYPESAKGQYVREWKEDAFTMMITPSVTRASSDLKYLDISERNCYFPDEGHLDIFHTYTQESCYIECRLKYIVNKCGCRPYFFRFGEGHVRPCLLSEFYCIAENAANLRTASPPANTPGFRWEATLNCSECLPTCHETVYNMDTLTSKDPMGVYTPADCYLDIYYKDAGFVKYWTSISFGSQELLVSFGGIMGLFLGVSFLSVVELLVYLMKFLRSVFPSKTKSSHRRAHVVHVRPVHVQSHRRTCVEKQPTSGSLGFFFENEMKLGAVELY